MNRGYVLTPLAEADLDDIWDYVAERFGFDLADGVLESLHRAFRLLAQNRATLVEPSNGTLKPVSTWSAEPVRSISMPDPFAFSIRIRSARL